ncbi:DNA-deoxyinosine glycosylase [Burkholderia pseudomallei]|uniref:DNA-deoxyinosine glycosylase n=1 Tax=Burkholderia pseudomallei TaxID=28450 RepID=UPI0005E54C2A|nr:DNA-deoxyinosine glycosylase [Burkholderia pseudomallei]CFL24213.1 G-T/U mismatch-specific DNA glycosylase-like protein [Burkholderia pseudomallei]
MMREGLAPIVDANSTHLILGTMPGMESLKFQRYYAHGANQFWQILETVYGEKIPDHYELRVEFLLHHGIALWDVLRGADREVSLDSAIKNELANDFTALFERFPRLRTIGLHGITAAKLFRRHIVFQRGVPIGDLQCTVLPSTSSTPGRYVKSFEEKMTCWRDFLLRTATY